MLVERKTKSQHANSHVRVGAVLCTLLLVLTLILGQPRIVFAADTNSAVSLEDIHRRSRSLIVSGNLREALELELKARQLNPADGLAHRRSSYIYSELGDKDRALQEARLAVRAEANSANALFNLAVMLQSGGRHEEAVQIYKKVLAVKPVDWQAELGRLQCLMALGYARSAVPKLEKLAESHGQESSIWQALSIAYLRSGDYEGAEDSALKAVALAPQSYGANLCLAEIELDVMQFVVARQIGWKLIEINPNRRESYLLLARSYCKNADKPDQARQVLAAARRNLPEDGELFFELGREFRKKGDGTGKFSAGGSMEQQQKWWQLSHDALKSAHRLSQAAPGPAIELARVLLRKGNAFEATRLLREATERDPGNKQLAEVYKGLREITSQDLAGYIRYCLHGRQSI